MKLSVLLILVNLIVLLAGIMIWPRIREGRLQLVLLLLAFSFIADAGSFISIRYFQTNVLIYNLFTLVQTLLILFITGSWIRPHPFSTLINYLSAAFFLFWVSENILLTGFTRSFADYSILAGGIIILFSNIIYLYRLSIVSLIPLINQARFWVSCSFLIYFSVSTILLSTMQLVATENTIAYKMFANFHLIVHIFTTLILLIAFRCLPLPRILRQ